MSVHNNENSSRKEISLYLIFRVIRQLKTLGEKVSKFRDTLAGNVREFLSVTKIISYYYGGINQGRNSHCNSQSTLLKSKP